MDKHEIEKESEHRTTQWPIWQIVALAVVFVFSIIYVIVGIDIGKDGQEVVQAPPTSTASWPTVNKSSPTPTFTSTSIPEPTRTPTSTPTSTSTPTPTFTPSPTPTPTNTPIVVITGIQTLGRLETTKYVMQTVVDIENEPANILDRFFGTDKLLLIVSGEAVAGFDLKKVKKSDIMVKDTTVSLTLPPPEILYSRMDNDKTYVYKRETGGIFRDFDPELETEARRLGEKQLAKGALENNILSQAEEFGIFYLRNFLQSLGFTKIEIKVSKTR